MTEERDGAEAHAGRLREQEREAESFMGFEDAEAETLRRLSAIRAAIAAEVTDADSTDAVRSALSRLFEGSVVHRSMPRRVHVELIGETWIEPVVREQAIEGYTENLTPILRRESLNKAANKEFIGFGDELFVWRDSAEQRAVI